MTDVDAPQPDAAAHSEIGRYDLEARLWARAHHEAAHAVVATVLDAHVMALEIWSGPPVGGRVEVEGVDDATASPSDLGFVRRIAYLLAGPLAEFIATNGPGAILNEAASLAANVLMAGVRDPGTIDADTDVGRVAGLFAARFGPDGEAAAAAAVDHLVLAIETVVRDQWRPIQAIALMALRHGRLTEEQLQPLWPQLRQLSGEFEGVLPLSPPESQ
jgi:hypothetical protein